jgi:hypothetical protein
MPDPELLREWHPLDHTPAPEFIPPMFDGPHVVSVSPKRCARFVALSRARGHDACTARMLGLPGRLVRCWDSEGLDLIAAGLRCDAVAVF